MILGLAGNLLKSLGGKKKKISGEKMAQNVMNDSKEKESVAKSSPSGKNSDVKGADLTPLEDIRDDMKASSKKSKDPLNLALDGIDSALFGIIDTLTKTNLLKKKIKSDENKVELDKKKSIRERFLEGASKFVKGATGAAKGVVGNTWDKIMRFLTWTLIGAIVNAIVKNWEEIQLQIKKVVGELTKLYEGLEPILTPIANWVKWIVGNGLEHTAKIDAKQKEMDHEGQYNKIMKQFDLMKVWEKDFNDSSDDLVKMMKELNNAKSKEEVQEILEKYRDRIKTDREPTNLTNKKGEIDPKTFIEDEDNPDETLRFGETFSSEDDLSVGPTDDQERIDTYYVDQNGHVRLKEDNSRPWGSRFINKDGLERRQYPPVEEKSSSLVSKFDLSDIQTFKFDESLTSISDWSSLDDNSFTNYIFVTKEGETGMNYMGSDFNFDYKMPETTLNIKELFLLEKLNK